MNIALDFKKAVAVPAMATALTFNPLTSQRADAALVTLDFEQFSPQLVGNTGVQILDFNESGFHIADSDDGSFGAWGDQNTAYIGEVAIITGGTDATVVTENDSSNFRVHSIRLAARNPAFSGVDTDILLSGTNHLGQSFTEIVTTNGFSLQEIFLGSAFNNVEEFRAIQGANGEQFQIASITVDTDPTISSVPVPAAVWLMGSALIGLGAASNAKQTFRKDIEKLSNDFV